MIRAPWNARHVLTAAHPACSSRCCRSTYIRNAPATNEQALKTKGAARNASSLTSELKPHRTHPANPSPSSPARLRLSRPPAPEADAASAASRCSGIDLKKPARRKAGRGQGPAHRTARRRAAEQETSHHAIANETRVRTRRIIKRAGRTRASKSHR